MLDKVRNWMEEKHMLESGERIVAGVSGGADSVALLLLLLALREEYRLEISVVHVNHGIRGKEAARDADYVKKLCEDYELPFFLYEESVPELAETWKMSEEAAGRKYRYQCFLETAKKTGATSVATAHHMGDQAETLLFHLIRGTNLAGGAGIRPVSVMEEGVRVIRPLLCLEKEEIISYLREQKISWCEDATNADNSYTRNKIRNRALPVFQEINEKAVCHVAQFASLLEEYETFFGAVTDHYMNEEVCCGNGCETDRYKLLQQETLLAKAVIYRMIVLACGKKQDITREHVQSVYELLGGQSGKQIKLPCDTEAVVSYNQLRIRKCINEKRVFFDYALSLEEIRNKEEELRICLPDGGTLSVKICLLEEAENIIKNIKNNYTKVFDCDTIKDTLHIRNPMQEDYFFINEDGSRKRIARYFIDRKIPVDSRKEQLLVTLDNEVLWHIGGRRGERYKVCETTKHILRLQYEGGNDEGSD